MKFIPFLVFIFLSSLVWSEDSENTVIVISMDGVRYDFPDGSRSGGFSKIEENGVKANFFKPVYQSTTYPGHVSMATGVSPDKHGIIHNGFFDRNKGSFSYSPEADWIEVPPIWALAEDQGIKTATYFWVGSETPWNGVPITYSKAPFNSRITETQKIEQILEWLDMPETEKPRLIMTWWHGTDSLGHKFGPNDSRVKKQLISQDKYLLKLIDEIENRSLWSKTTLLLVSDHGMSEITNLINIKTLLAEAAPEARLSLGPAVGHIFLKDQNATETVLKALRINKDLMAYKKENLPTSLKLLHEERTGDIVVLTRAPNMLTQRNQKNPPKGMHGYNVEFNKEMNGIFYAYGNKVSKKKLSTVSQLDIAPTIAHLLDIDVGSNFEGKIIPLNK